MFGLAVLIGSIALAASGEAGGVRPPANLYVTYSNAAAFERAFSTRRNWLRDDSVVTIKAARCSIVCCSCRKGIQEPSYDVYLFYEPDMEYLKNTALTLDMARNLPKGSGKKRLVFAPTKYLDSIHLEMTRVEFCQLPIEIYKAVKRKA